MNVANISLYEEIILPAAYLTYNATKVCAAVSGVIGGAIGGYAGASINGDKILGSVVGVTYGAVDFAIKGGIRGALFFGAISVIYHTAQAILNA